MCAYYRCNEKTSLSFAEQITDIVDYVQDAGSAENYSEGTFAKLLGIEDNITSDIFPIE